jgi:hypothetical protein
MAEDKRTPAEKQTTLEHQEKKPSEAQPNGHIPPNQIHTPTPPTLTPSDPANTPDRHY